MERVEREKIELGDEKGSGLSSSSPSHLCLCRICHEEEEMEASTMEAPCNCSGTLKFAHRECIQRWCDEKGNTTCEICLQNFKPGYALSPKASQLIDVMVTIRGSSEVPRWNYEQQIGGSDDDETDDNNPECYTTTERGTSFSHPIPLIVATILLAWQLVKLITGDDDYPFALTTVLMLRVGGILLPLYLVMRMISAIQCSRLQQSSWNLQIQRVEAMARVEENQDIQQHIIEIQS